MKITYSKQQCAKKMLFFIFFCALALIVVVTPYFFYFILNGNSDKGSTLIYDGFSLIICTFVLVALSIQSKREKLHIWRINKKKLRLKLLLLSVVLGSFWQILTVGIYYFSIDTYLHNTLSLGISNVVMHVACFAFLIPLMEELAFRKWIIDMMERGGFSQTIIILVSSILFFCLHLGGEVIRVDTLLISIPLCLIYMKTHDVRYCIVAHIVNNFFATMLGFGIL